MPSKKTPAPAVAPQKSPKKWSTTPFIWALFGLLVLQFFQVMNLKQRVDELSPGAEEGTSLSDFFGGEEEENEEDAMSTLLFDFVNNLGTYEINKARYEANLTALQTVMQDGYWAEQGLSLVAPEGTFTQDDLDYVFLDATTSGSILTISLAYDGTLAVYPYGTELSLSDDEKVETMVTELKGYLSSDLADLRAMVQTVNVARADFTGWLALPELQTLLTENGLLLLAEVEQQESYVYSFQNPEAVIVAECRIMKVNANHDCDSMSPEAEVQGGVLADIKEPIKNLFVEVDTRTVLQKTVDSQKAMIEEVLADPAFLAALDNAGLTVSAATENETTIQYSISVVDGEVLRLLILDKASGEVRVTLPDGQESQSLAAAVQLLEFSSKKKLWTSPVSSRTMLS